MISGAASETRRGRPPLMSAERRAFFEAVAERGATSRTVAACFYRQVGIEVLSDQVLDVYDQRAAFAGAKPGPGWRASVLEQVGRFARLLGWPEDPTGETRAELVRVTRATVGKTTRAAAAELRDLRLVVAGSLRAEARAR